MDSEQIASHTSGGSHCTQGATRQAIKARIALPAVLDTQKTEVKTPARQCILTSSFPKTGSRGWGARGRKVLQPLTNQPTDRPTDHTYTLTPAQRADGPPLRYTWSSRHPSRCLLA